MKGQGGERDSSGSPVAVGRVNLRHEHANGRIELGSSPAPRTAVRLLIGVLSLLVLVGLLLLVLQNVFKVT